MKDKGIRLIKLDADGRPTGEVVRLPGEVDEKREADHGPLEVPAPREEINS